MSNHSRSRPWRWAPLLAGALLALALVAGCAGDDADPDDDAAAAADDADDAEADGADEEGADDAEADEDADVVPPPTDADLTIWTDEERQAAVQALGDRFAEEYGVSVAVQQLGFGDIRDQLSIVGPAGEGPDIVLGAHDWLGELAADALLVPLDLGDRADEFFGPAVEAFTYEGELLGLPLLTENIAFFRNPRLVPEAPTTWDHVEELARELQASGEVEQAYLLQEDDPYHYYPFMSAHGGYVFGLDADGNDDPDDVGLDSEGALRAAARLERMVGDGLLRADIDWEVMHSLFEREDGAMMITGPWALGRIRESGVDYAISAIPDDEATGAPFLGVQGFMVSSFSEEPLLAQTFLLEFIATEDALTEWYEAIPHMSAYLPVREQIDDPDLAAFAEAGEDGRPMPAIPQMSAVWTAWTDAILLTFQQQEAAEDAFGTAADQVRDTIAGD